MSASNFLSILFLRMQRMEDGSAIAERGRGFPPQTRSHRTAAKCDVKRRQRRRRSGIWWRIQSDTLLANDRMVMTIFCTPIVTDEYFQ